MLVHQLPVCVCVYVCVESLTHSLQSDVTGPRASTVPIHAQWMNCCPHPPSAALVASYNQVFFKTAFADFLIRALSVKDPDNPRWKQSDISISELLWAICQSNLLGQEFPLLQLLSAEVVRELEECRYPDVYATVTRIVGDRLAKMPYGRPLSYFPCVISACESPAVSARLSS